LIFLSNDYNFLTWFDKNIKCDGKTMYELVWIERDIRSFYTCNWYLESTQQILMALDKLVSSGKSMEEISKIHALARNITNTFGEKKVGILTYCQSV
jgi:hypothetical protein